MKHIEWDKKNFRKDFSGSLDNSLHRFHQVEDFIQTQVNIAGSTEYQMGRQDAAREIDEDSVMRGLYLAGLKRALYAFDEERKNDPSQTGQHLDECIDNLREAIKAEIKKGEEE